MTLYPDSTARVWFVSLTIVIMCRCSWRKIETEAAYSLAGFAGEEF